MKLQDLELSDSKWQLLEATGFVIILNSNHVKSAHQINISLNTRELSSHFTMKLVNSKAQRCPVLYDKLFFEYPRKMAATALSFFLLCNANQSQERRQFFNVFCLSTLSGYIHKWAILSSTGTQVCFLLLAKGASSDEKSLGNEECGLNPRFPLTLKFNLHHC